MKATKQATYMTIVATLGESILTNIIYKDGTTTQPTMLVVTT